MQKPDLVELINKVIVSSLCHRLSQGAGSQQAAFSPGMLWGARGGDPLGNQHLQFVVAVIAQTVPPGWLDP